MRTVKNILRHELIGLPCEIIRTSNKSQIGIKGRIVDETLKIIEIKTTEGKKMVAKKNTIFRVSIDDKKVDIDGNFIGYRPEDRIKKRFTKW